MKQSAARTLGIAVLGAAFAAAAAGTSSAAVLPVDAAAAAVPAGTALDTVTKAVPTVQDAAGDLLSQKNQKKAVGDATAPVAGLLGGLPSGDLAADGLSANGLPLGR